MVCMLRTRDLQLDLLHSRSHSFKHVGEGAQASKPSLPHASLPQKLPHLSCRQLMPLASFQGSHGPFSIFCVILQSDGTARNHVGWQLLLQLVAAVLLIGMLAAGIVGLTQKSHVGQDCSWCDGFACPRIKWWDCQPAGTIVSDVSPSAVSAPAQRNSPVAQPTPASGRANDTVVVDYG